MFFFLDFFACVCLRIKVVDDLVWICLFVLIFHISPFLVFVCPGTKVVDDLVRMRVRTFVRALRRFCSVCFDVSVCALWDQGCKDYEKQYVNQSCYRLGVYLWTQKSCLSVSLLHVFLSVVPFRLFVCLSVCLYLPTWQPVCPSVCAYLPVCTPACPCVPNFLFTSFAFPSCRRSLFWNQVWQRLATSDLLGSVRPYALCDP